MTSSVKSVLFIGALSIVLLSVAIIPFSEWIWMIPGVVNNPLNEYDFIIVGAGTAGCVVARRLAEKCNCSVLLIEAGREPPWASKIPLVGPTLQLSSIDWAFKTQPQKNSHWGMNEQRSFWPRGKVFGGSSTINYLMHMWGSPSDYNAIASLIGDVTWNFDHVSRYFRKLESYSGSFSKRKLSGRGRKGLLPVGEAKGIPSTLAKAFLNGVMDLGLNIVDLNSNAETGAMLSQNNVKDGERVTPFQAYLKPLLGNSNISIVMNTLATKILISDNHTYGIEILNLVTSVHSIVRSRKEVILCAGAIGSPHLLLLSGIGPIKDLIKFNVPLVADLPGVGRNLQDHLSLPMYFHLESPVSMTTAKAQTFKEIKKYIFQGEGYLSNSGVEVVARTILPGSNRSEADIFYILLNVGSVNEGIFKNIANLEENVFIESFPEAQNISKEGFILLPTCSHPRSRGYLTLTSADIRVQPVIDPRYLDHKDDVSCFVKAIKMATRLGSTRPLRALGARLHLPAFKSCARFSQSLENNAYLECWVRTAAMTSYHPVGTCAIGRKHDYYGVLDSKFRVRYIDKLRVVDASSIPTLISATPHALIVMLAEKASDIIIKEISKKK